MTGRSIEYVFPPRGDARRPTAGDAGPRGRRPRAAGVFSGVDLSVRAGEIVGLAGPRRRRPLGDPRDAVRRPPAVGRHRARRSGSELRRGSVPDAVKAGVGLRPGGAQEPGPAARPGDLPQRHRLLAGPVRPRSACSTAATERRRAARGDRVPRPAPGRRRPPGAPALGRQPAEGRAGPLAAARVQGAAARRAHPRRRRRRPRRDLRPGPRRWPTPGSPSWSSRARSRRCSGSRTGCWSSARAASCTRDPRARSTSPASSTWSWKEAPHERAEHRPTGRQGTTAASTNTVVASAHAATWSGRRRRGAGRRLMSGPLRPQPRAWWSRSCVICVVGVITAGDRFASVDNALTILRLAAVIGVVSIGMTFVITGGGIDLSVGAILGAVRRCGRPPSPRRPWPRTPTGWSWCSPRSAVGAALRAGQRGADRLRQGRPVHHDPGDAGLGPRARRDHLRAADPDRRRVDGFKDFSPPTSWASRCLVVIFALVAVGGLGPAQPHDLRPPHPRRRRQPRGGAARRHQRQAAHRDALRARRALLRHRRRS